MTWDDLNPASADAADRERQKQAHEAKAAALKQAVVRALGPAKQTEFKEYLRAIALGYSYTSGRSAEDVAFAEGRRWLAVELLKMGEVINE